jgi:hypothetical protein
VAVRSAAATAWLPGQLRHAHALSSAPACNARRRCGSHAGGASPGCVSGSAWTDVNASHGRVAGAAPGGKTQCGGPALLADLRQRAPDLDETIAHAEAFTGLIRDHAPDRLDPWLQRAQDSTVRHLRSFAKRLSADYDAVRAAVDLAWSNGPTEGHINRLKTIKRQMYGRAKLDLLGRRFLLAA